MFAWYLIISSLLSSAIAADWDSSQPQEQLGVSRSASQHDLRLALQREIDLVNESSLHEQTKSAIRLKLIRSYWTLSSEAAPDPRDLVGMNSWTKPKSGEEDFLLLRDWIPPPFISPREGAGRYANPKFTKWLTARLSEVGQYADLNEWITQSSLKNPELRRKIEADIQFFHRKGKTLNAARRSALVRSRELRSELETGLRGAVLAEGLVSRETFLSWLEGNKREKNPWEGLSRLWLYARGKYFFDLRKKPHIVAGNILKATAGEPAGIIHHYYALSEVLERYPKLATLFYPTAPAWRGPHAELLLRQTLDRFLALDSDHSHAKPLIRFIERGGEIDTGVTRVLAEKLPDLVPDSWKPGCSGLEDFGKP